jgi:predicted alpha/beta-hydrolase family hydrolase
MPDATSLRIPLHDGSAVSGLALVPGAAKAGLVLAHGAGAGMSHPFMATVVDRLADRGVATLRYQFPYMEKGTGRPDPANVAQVTVRAAVAEAVRRLPDIPLFAGGKSFGGRMTSEAQAGGALPGVIGLVFLGFPLHPAKRPSAARAQHLVNVRIPMLFLRGTRDALAQPELLAQVTADLGNRATLKSFLDADHSFHVPKRSGSTDAQVMAELCDTISAWVETALGDGSPR